MCQDLFTAIRELPVYLRNPSAVRGIYLLAGADFLSSTFDVSWVANGADNTQTALPGYKQPINSLNLRMGAGVQF
jgi:hypothetical protein